MAVEGICSERFEAVRDQLASQLDSGADVGASVAVVHRGELVVDLWGGTITEEGNAPWQADTLVNVWSTTKTMTFVVALMLADQGLLDLDAPVARYWPAFAANGKDGVLIRHLLSHTAGLSGWTEALLDPKDAADWELCTSRLAAQAPWWEPGSRSGYHAVTQGYLIGEVVRRVTGTSIGNYFAAEVAAPLGADFFIGLPASEEHRVSVVIPGGPLDGAGQAEDSIAVRSLRSSNIDATSPQHRWWREAEIPAANGHGNARSVATIQSVVTGRGEAFGVRLFSETTAERIFETQASGPDLVLSGFDLRFGMGYGLSSPMIPIGDRSCFWGGYGGSIVVMDQDAELTVAYMMNKMAPSLIGDLRGFGLVLAAAAAVAS